MSNLLTHCGSKRCSLEQLLTIPEPDKTQSYTPLNHYDFAVNVRSVTTDLLRDFSFVKDDCSLSAEALPLTVNLYNHFISFYGQWGTPKLNGYFKFRGQTWKVPHVLVRIRYTSKKW